MQMLKATKPKLITLYNYIHHKVFPARHRSGLLICARAVALALALRRCPVSGPSRLSASEASHALGDSVLGALVVVKERLPYVGLVHDDGRRR